MAITRIKILLLFSAILLSNTIAVFGQVTVWEENFDSYSNNSGVDGTGNIGDYPASVTKWTIDASGTNLQNNQDYLKVNSSYFQGRDVNGKGIWLSETINISSYTNISVSADFWKAGGTMESTDSINFYYKIDGGSWNTIVLLNDDISTTPQTYSVSNLNGNSMELKVEIVLPDGFQPANAEIYAFDNVLVQAIPAPSCTTPISPTDGAINVAVNGALTWNSAQFATGYYLYFGTDVAATNIENGTDLGNVTTYTPTPNMDYLTDYYWKIVPYNGAGSATGCSVWSFTTEDITYCPSSGNMDYLDCVTLVNFNTLNNATGKPAGYNDYTSISTDVIIGNSYNLTVNLNTDGNYTNYAMVWIDWNHDGDFTDTGESFDLGTATNVTDGITSNSPLSVTIPATASLGSTRMRVSTKWNAYPTSCETNFDGETEDYSINILAACNAPDIPTLSASSGTICTGNSTTLSIASGNLNDADHWQWYSGSCGGTAIGTGTSIVVSPTTTTTYYARGEGTCPGTTCGSTTVTVANIQIPLTATPNTVDCPNSTNGTIDLSVPFPIQFNSPDYIDIGSTLLSNQGAFTLEGWIKTDDFANMPNRTSLFGQNDAIEFFFNGSTLMCWTTSGGNVSVGTYPTDNQWHHVAAVGNGTDIRLYIDGALAATGGISTTNYGSDTNYSSKIGAGVVDATGGVFPGQMIKVGFYSTALTATEISNLASGYYEYTGSETGLLAGYNFFEGTGTTLGSVITGTDGTFSGSPTWVDNYTYAWTKTGDPGFSATTQDLSGVTPGTYTVTVTNSSLGCPNTGSWTINFSDNEDPTITCPATVVVTPDPGLCTASGFGLGSPTVSDNCGIASVTNNGPATYFMGNTIVTWTVTDDAGNTATCDQTVTVQPAAIIDVAVVDLGNSCQSGETGSTTTITWDITLVQGTNSWTYDYTINDGTTDVVLGTNVNATGSIQISYTMNNTTAADKTYTITLTNVKDSCGVAEINTGNNSDVVTLFGVPDTGNIIPD